MMKGVGDQDWRILRGVGEENLTAAEIPDFLYLNERGILCCLENRNLPTGRSYRAAKFQLSRSGKGQEHTHSEVTTLGAHAPPCLFLLPDLERHVIHTCLRRECQSEWLGNMFHSLLQPPACEATNQGELPSMGPLRDLEALLGSVMAPEGIILFIVQ